MEKLENLKNLKNFNKINQLRGNGNLLKFLIGLIALCKCDKTFRKWIRFQILPPLKSAKIRPEEENSLRGYLTQLMSTSDINLNTTVGEFLYVLCKENVNRLIKYTGMGNAMGYLHHKGLLNSTNVENEEYSSDNSEVEEYEKIQHLVDPITGIQVESNLNNKNTNLFNNEIENEKLLNDMQKLQELNLITPVTIKDGKLIKSNFKNIEKK